jgi:hypothetical protein
LVERPSVLGVIPAFSAGLEGQTAMKPETKSLEECLQEAAEYERLAALTRLESTRKILALSASYCRKLAVRVAERDRTHLH